MKKSTRRYPQVQVDTAPVGAVAHAGGVLLTHTAEATGLPGALTEGLAPWRKPLAVHDPAKVLTDLAVSLVLGGDALCDAALLRAEPGLYGLVGSEATISRTITALAADAKTSLKAINTARAAARLRAWDLAGQRSPGHHASASDPVVVDLDATLVTAHSDKELAAPTFKQGYGFHPLCAFVDHGADGTGEPLALRLRPGRAGSNTAADHIAVTRDALAQLPGINPTRPGKNVLIRADGAGGTKDFTRWLTGRRVQYSVGYTLPFNTPDLLTRIPEHVWTPAYDSDGDIRDGAYVAELTNLLDLTDWPPGMRVIARKERPHPGAQLRFTDTDGKRVTAFATNTPRGQLADLELRHRRRARCEDRIRIAKDTGLTNLPLQGFDANRIWCAIVMLAGDLCLASAFVSHLGLSEQRCFWPNTPTRVGGEGWSPMTEKLEGMTSMPKNAKKSATPDEAERAAVQQLVKAARGRGDDLTGPDGLLKTITATVLQAALEEEMTDHLGHEKHHGPAGGAGNIRNGTRPKTVLTDAAGEVVLEVPRDRSGTFEPVIVKKRQRRLNDVDAVAISLYAKGLTTGEISAHFAEVYGASISKDTISRITDRVEAEMLDWVKRPLHGVYAAIFIDAIYVKVRDGQVGNQPFYAAIGVDLGGRRDVLGLWAGQGGGESAKFWMSVLADLKNRGVRDVFFVVCDGLKGLPDAVSTVFPQAIVQACVIQVLTEVAVVFLLVSALLDSVRPRDLVRGRPTGPGRVGRAEGGLGRRRRRSMGTVAAA